MTDIEKAELKLNCIALLIDSGHYNGDFEDLLAKANLMFRSIINN